MIATEVGLGVRPSNKAMFAIIATPAAAYFNAAKAVTVWISTEYVRAAQGGTGEAKCGGNYAASLLAQQEAAKQGCDQVVWLDAREHRYLEEMGGMNICLVEKKNNQIHLVTPELTGTILPGITRLSLIQISKDLDWGFSERRISTQEWQEKSISGELS